VGIKQEKTEKNGNKEKIAQKGNFDILLAALALVFINLL